MYEVVVGFTPADLKPCCPPDCLSIFVNGEAAGNLVPSPRDAPVMPALGLMEEPEPIRDLAGELPLNVDLVSVDFVKGLFESSRSVGVEGGIVVVGALWEPCGV